MKKSKNKLLKYVPFLMFTLIFLGIGTSIMYFSISDYLNKSKLMEVYERTTATVTKYNTYEDDNHVIFYNAVFEYEVNSNKYTIVDIYGTTEMTKKYQIGDILTCYYDKNDPSEAFLGNLNLDLGLVSMGFVFFSVGFYAIIREIVKKIVRRESVISFGDNK